MIKDTTTTYRTSTATKKALIALAKQDGVKPSRLIDDLIGGYCKYREKNPEVKSFYKWLHK